MVMIMVWNSLAMAVGWSSKGRGAEGKEKRSKSSLYGGGGSGGDGGCSDRVVVFAILVRGIEREKLKRISRDGVAEKTIEEVAEFEPGV